MLAGMGKRVPWLPWTVVGAVAFSAWWLWGKATRTGNTQWTWGGPPGVDPWGEAIHRDPAEVVPAFADKIELVMQRMRARGFDPVVHEAYRTPERAAHLAEKGTGIKLSLHSYNGAVDIVDSALGWGASKAFKDALVEEVERAGLMSGRRFSTKDDWAHAQAVQTAHVARFIASNWDERNTLAAATA